MDLYLLAGENALYFEWLINQVGGDEWCGEYLDSLSRVFFRHYYYENQLDYASSEHGKALRVAAINDGLPTTVVLSGEASVLEVLVALAIRVNDYLLYDGSNDDNTPKYFDEIMETLGFKTDRCYIDAAIDKFLNGKAQITRKRRFKPFEMTLWQQVNMFFHDRFELESDI